MAFDQQFNWDMDRLIKDLTAQRKKRLAFNQDISSREMAETERQGIFNRNQTRQNSFSKNKPSTLGNRGVSGSTSKTDSTTAGLTQKDKLDFLGKAFENRGEDATNQDLGSFVEQGMAMFNGEKAPFEDPFIQRQRIAKDSQEKFNKDVRSFVDDKGVFHATNYEGPYKASWDNEGNDMQEGAAALSRNARWAGQGGKGNAPTEKTPDGKATTELGELLEGIPDPKVINVPDVKQAKDAPSTKKDLPIPDNITSEDVSGFLKSQHTNPLDPLYGRTVGESIWTKGQNFMNKSRVDDDATWTGETTLTAAMRQSDIGGTLGERKEMAYGLKKKYPKLSEEQLAQIIAKGKNKKTSRSVTPTRRKPKKDEWSGSW